MKRFFTFYFSVFYISQMQTGELEVDAAIENVQRVLSESKIQMSDIDLPTLEECRYPNYVVRKGPRADRCLDLDDDGFAVSVELAYDVCYSVLAKSREQAINIIKTKDLPVIMRMITADSKALGDWYGLNFGPAYCDIA